MVEPTNLQPAFCSALDIASLSGVLADGRVIVVRPIATPSGARFEVVAPDGSTASFLDAEGVLGGFLSAPLNATTTVGHDGFVVVVHEAWTCLTGCWVPGRTPGPRSRRRLVIAIDG